VHKKERHIYGRYQYLYGFIAIVLFSAGTYRTYSQSFQAEKDSIERFLENTCHTDTCRYRILSELFWQNNDVDFERAKYYGEKAFREIKNTKVLDALGEANFIKGSIFQQEAKYDSAYECFTLSLERWKEINYRNAIGWCHYHLAEVNDAIGKQETATRLMKLSLQLFTEDSALYDAHEATARVAEMYMRTGQYDSADVYYMKRLSIDKKLSNKSGEIWTCIQISRFYNEANAVKKSIEYLNYALREAEKNEDNNITDVYGDIGRYFFELKKNNQIAREYCKKGLEKRGRDTYLYLLLSEISLYEGNDSLALKYAHLSLANEKSRHGVSKAYKTFGMIYTHMGDYRSATDYYKRCYENGCSSCPEITFHDALIAIADLYIRMHDLGQAQMWYLKALAVAEGYNSKKEIAISRMKIGNYYRFLRQIQTAERYYAQSLSAAIAAKNIALMKSISDTLDGFYRERNDFKSAYRYSHYSRILADSLAKIDRKANLADLEMKFEFDRIKKENEARRALSEEEIKRQKIYLISLLIISALLCTLGIVVFVSYRLKQKDNRQLKIQKEELERISEKLHDSDQKKLHFFTNISHEFRTPLTLILGPIEKLIAGNNGKNTTAQLLSVIRRNTLRLYHLINQLLDIRKLDAGNVRLRASEGDIAVYCESVFSTFKHLAEENAITYSFTASGDNVVGWFDRDILEKALANLLSNAFKYTPRSGRINLKVGAATGPADKYSHAEIIVSDNGKGIPDDQIKYVFDRYYQVENSNAGYNTGTGIGLAYTKELIHLHRGEIAVHSTPGGGTTFTVTIPIHESQYTTDEKTYRAPNGNDVITDDIRQKYLTSTIVPDTVDTPEDSREHLDNDMPIMLIVEDNADLREFIKSIFIDDYVIEEAANGESGYRIATERIPDIIVSDIMMPGINGLELCHKLKNNDSTGHIPILILTAKAGDENEIEGLQTGADDYVTKPFNAEILALRVQRLIDVRNTLRKRYQNEFLLDPKQTTLTSPDDEFLRRAIRLVEENISNPKLNVEMLVKELAVSRSQLFRKLKALTNSSVSHFIRNLRLKKAAQLLQSTSYTITEVLYLSGFNSPSYFSTSFKEVYGCLPREYQKKSGTISAPSRP
jgi:signal transduction histidine kinase/DNA-binding response OmpR family regulator